MVVYDSAAASKVGVHPILQTGNLAAMRIIIASVFSKESASFGLNVCCNSSGNDCALERRVIVFFGA